MAESRKMLDVVREEWSVACDGDDEDTVTWAIKWANPLMGALERRVLNGELQARVVELEGKLIDTKKLLQLARDDRRAAEKMIHVAGKDAEAAEKQVGGLREALIELGKEASKSLMSHDVPQAYWAFLDKVKKKAEALTNTKQGE